MDPLPQKRNRPKLAIILVAALIILTNLGALSAFHPIKASILLNVILPIVAVYYFKMHTLFGYFKIITLALGRALIVIGILINTRFDLAWFCFLYLQINIFEAVIMALSKRFLLNAIAGLSLMLSAGQLQLEWTGIYILMPPDWWFWMVAYTLWNWWFMALVLEKYLIVPHTIILFSPIVFCAVMNFDGIYWLAIRETTLGLGLALFISIRAQAKPFIQANISKKQLNNLSELIHKPKTASSFLFIIVLLSIIQVLY